MARVINVQTGWLEDLPASEAATGVAKGLYEYPEDTVVSTPAGGIKTVKSSSLSQAEGLGYREATPQEAYEQELQEQYGDSPGTTFLEGVADTASFGAYSALQGGPNRGVGERARRQPGIRTAGELVGGVLPIGAGAGILKAGKAIRGAVPGAVGAITAGAAEGGLFAAGATLAESGLSDDPLTVERVMGNITTGMILGGTVGGGLHVLSKAGQAAKGLAQKMLEPGQPAVRLSADEIEMAAKRAIDVAEMETPKGVDIANDFIALRETYRRQIPILKRMREMGLSEETAKVGMKVATAMGNLRNKPETLATSPRVALDTLQMHRTYMEMVQKEAGNIRLNLAKAGYGPLPNKPQGGARWRMLDELEGTYKANEELTNRIRQADALPKRVAEIEKAAEKKIREVEKAELIDAREAAKPGLGTKVLQALAFGVATKAAFPILGMGAPLVGGWAAKFVGKNAITSLGNKMGQAAEKTAVSMNKAMKSFIDPGKRLARTVPILASKALQASSYASEMEAEGYSSPRQSVGSQEPIRALYKKRAEELKSQVTLDPMTLQPVMKQQARKAVGDKLLGMRAISPGVADKAETIIARRVEFLASKLPKNPGIPGWEPSKTEIAKYARYQAVSEQPMLAMEAMASGQLLPEDVETLQVVYPELYRWLSNEILGGLVKAGGVKKFPIWKRLMMSMFTGKPLEPSLQPNVLAVLQGQFIEEPNTAGGMVAPPIEPNFGSLGSASASEPTAAQSLSSE